MLSEIVSHISSDVAPIDGDIVISIFSALNMVTSKRVNELMLDCTEKRSGVNTTHKSTYIYLRSRITSISKINGLHFA